MATILLLFALKAAITCYDSLATAHSMQEVDEPAANLPKTSAKFFAQFSSNDADETLDSLQIDGDAFNRFVKWSIHRTDKPFWHIKNKSHARVFDLLNWSRQERLMPKPIDINKICHKGMENLQEGDEIDIPIPSKPNEHIPTEVWTNLWKSCHKKLSSNVRTASNCIDIPGVVVTSTNPNESNNPCNAEHRMVDGAHRLCLRKYGVVLLEGEAAELQSLLSNTSSLNDRTDIVNQITEKEMLIDKVSKAMFLEMDQDTFESMLIYSENPIRHHEEWAQTMHLSKEFKEDWNLWMRQVITFVHDWRESDDKSKINDEF